MHTLVARDRSRPAFPPLASDPGRGPGAAESSLAPER